MSANSPIRSVPQQVAEPNYFIQRFLRSVQPFYYQHAQYGQEYFDRSRRAGDKLLKEDWELAAQFSPKLTNVALPHYHQVDPIVAPSLPASSLLGTQPAVRQHSTSPGLGPADNSSGRGKHSRPRTGNALRTAPYARRPKEATPVYHSHHASPASPGSADDLGELRENRRHAGAGQERRVVSADDNVRAYLFACGKLYSVMRHMLTNPHRHCPAEAAVQRATTTKQRGAGTGTGVCHGPGRQRAEEQGCAAP